MGLLDLDEPVLPAVPPVGEPLRAADEGVALDDLDARRGGAGWYLEVGGSTTVRTADPRTAATTSRPSPKTTTRVTTSTCPSADVWCHTGPP
jgi:hypothetical protein